MVDVWQRNNTRSCSKQRQYDLEKWDVRGRRGERERNTFNSIPTALTLDHQTVDRLRAIARKLLLDSPDFKQLVKDLEG